jgi:hypothetical protein
MRSIDPRLAAKPGMTHAEIERERRARLKLRENLKARLIELDDPDTPGVLPGFGPECAGGSRTAVKGPHESELQIIGEKFVRVAVWVMRERSFVWHATIETHVCKIEDVQDVANLVREGDALDIFPGIRITLRTAEDNPGAHLALFELWGRLKLFVSVVPESVTQVPKRSPTEAGA